ERRAHARAPETLGDLRGRHARALPRDDRVRALPAVLRAQRPRRRLRGRARGGHRAHRALPRGRAVRARGGGTGAPRSAPGHGPVPVRGRGPRRVPPHRQRARQRRVRHRAPARRRDPPRDVAVLRRGRVPRRRRARARHPAHPRGGDRPSRRAGRGRPRAGRGHRAVRGHGARRDRGWPPVNVIDTTPSVVLVLAIGVLFAAGVYLLLERSLTRVLLGFILMGNGANLLFLVAGGRAGGAPIIGETPEGEMSDPLVQAMVLTAIVITLGITAFVLAMAYRSWQL